MHCVDALAILLQHPGKIAGLLPNGSICNGNQLSALVNVSNFLPQQRFLAFTLLPLDMISHLCTRWAKWEHRSSCLLFDKVPGLTAVSTAYDWMHTKYLGVDQIVAGSVLHILCFHTLPQSPLLNLRTCWQFLSQSYKELGIVERYRGMRKLTIFSRKKAGPKLKGRAAQIQHLAQPLLALWKQYIVSTS